MAIQLRQICLVAEQLKPTIDDLVDILGIQACFVDPGVKVFGLENTLMCMGKNFLEVVAPIQENTAAGRYLSRRKGDGGYMVITQADSTETRLKVRQNALDNGVRVAHEVQRGDWNLCQLHPGDLKAAFFEVESDAENDFEGTWHPAGGNGWQDKINQNTSIDFAAVVLQAEDPEALAKLWASVADTEVYQAGGIPTLSLNNAELKFVPLQDDRGPGLIGMEILVADREKIITTAKTKNCYLNEHRVSVGGIYWQLIDAT